MRFLGTAIGTYGSGIQSHSDFISKTKDKANTVVFKQVNLKFESTRAFLHTKNEVSYCVITLVQIRPIGKNIL